MYKGNHKESCIYMEYVHKTNSAMVAKYEYIKCARGVFQRILQNSSSLRFYRIEAQ